MLTEMDQPDTKSTRMRTPFLLGRLMRWPTNNNKSFIFGFADDRITTAGPICRLLYAKPALAEHNLNCSPRNVIDFKLNSFILMRTERTFRGLHGDRRWIHSTSHFITQSELKFMQLNVGTCAVMPKGLSPPISFRFFFLTWCGSRLPTAGKSSIDLFATFTHNKKMQTQNTNQLFFSISTLECVRNGRGELGEICQLTLLKYRWLHDNFGLEPVTLEMFINTHHFFFFSRLVSAGRLIVWNCEIVLCFQ